MIRKPVQNPKKSESSYIIQQLNKLGVHQDKTGTPLHSLDYITLLSLLAIQRAVES